MEMDDEAFARQLQQQLLDEEAALMQAQQASQQQQQNFQQQARVQPQSNLVNNGPGIDPYQQQSQTPYQYQQQAQHNVNSEFDEAAYARRLQHQGLVKPEGQNQPQTTHAARPQPVSDDPDLEYARRIQEEMDMGNPEPHHGGRSRQEQEEEDARLARLLAGMMEQTGASLRDFNFDGHADLAATATGNAAMTSGATPNIHQQTHSMPSNGPTGYSSQGAAMAPSGQPTSTGRMPTVASSSAAGPVANAGTVSGAGQMSAAGSSSFPQRTDLKPPPSYSPPARLSATEPIPNNQRKPPPTYHQDPNPQWKPSQQRNLEMEAPIQQRLNPVIGHDPSQLPPQQKPPSQYPEPAQGPSVTQRIPQQLSDQRAPGSSSSHPSRNEFQPTLLPNYNNRGQGPMGSAGSLQSYEPSAPPQYSNQRREDPGPRPTQRYTPPQPGDPNQRQAPVYRNVGTTPSQPSDPSQRQTPTFRTGGPTQYDPTSPPMYDPSPLNQGPLGGGVSPPRQPKGRVGNSSPKRGENSIPRSPAPMEPPVDIMQGDAFLDVPVPAKKEKKKKKKGLFGFGLLNGKREDRDERRGSATKATPEAKTSSSSGGRTFGIPRRRGSHNRLTLGSDGGSTINTTRSEDGDENPIVPFPIPEPVARPPDTIGALPGPLPYSISVSKDAPSAPEETVGRRPQLTLGRNSGTCAVCRQPVNNPLNALDKKYHNECFRCVTCHDQIDPSNPFAYVENNGDKQPMHRRCYAELYGIKCAVCRQSIPCGSDGKVSFVKHPFFDTEQMCPHHARSLTRRCTGCHRFEPENDPFADLNDVGRCVCLSCCRSVIVDSGDAQPLWDKVINFFENKLNMPIWKDLKEVPILVVGYNALNDQMSKECNVHGGASQIMTRGLCLTEHESGRRFKMNKLKFNAQSMSFMASDAEDRGFTYFQVPDARKVNPDASVTAILCLSGLPRDLAASVLAHEATHAWIKLHPRFDISRPIPPQVEEGCAQLIALLFLNDGLDPAPPLENNDGSGPSDEKLRQYFKYSIETDDHEIYGLGYRKAAMAYSKIGIEALMSHVVLYQEFPET